MRVRDVIELAKITSLGSLSIKSEDESILALFNYALTQVYLKIPALTQTQNLVLLCDKRRYMYLDNSYFPISASTVEGKPLSINDNTDLLSIRDLGNHIVFVPNTVHRITDKVSLLLQLKPPKIDYCNIDTTEFSLDDALVPATLAYMAYTASKNISEKNGIVFLQEFDKSIIEVRSLGLYVPFQSSNAIVFKDGGFV